MKKNIKFIFIPIVIKTCAIVISTEGRIVSGRSGEICYTNCD